MNEEKINEKKMSKKKLMTFGLIGLFALAFVSAGLLSYFGLFTFSATINPAISVDGKLAPSISHDMPEEAPGGESFCWLHKVQNDASIDIDLSLVTTPEVHKGVTVGMYGVPETTTLELTSKDDDWKATSAMKATVIFDTVNPNFVGTLTTTGLVASTNYALIYYPDNEDRFASDKWNGDGGQVIDIFTTDGTGNYDDSFDVDLARNLPHSDDWNINPSPNYCDLHNGFDDYEHCRGAKLWIVPVSDLTSDGEEYDLPLTTWNPTAWLFETDLITYSDCDFDAGLPKVVDFTVDRIGPNSVLETKSHTMTPMLICYDFDEMAYGEFNIESKLLPVA